MAEDKPLAGYKRIWAFVFFILLLFTNLSEVFFVILPKQIAGTIAYNDFGMWVFINFMLIIILTILYFAKTLLLFSAKLENKILE